MRKILIIDRNTEHSQMAKMAISHITEQLGCEVVITLCRDALDAFPLARDHDIIMIDIVSDQWAQDLALIAHRMCKPLILTGMYVNDMPYAQEADNVRFLPKPWFDLRVLQQILARYLGRYRENAVLQLQS